MKKIACIGNMNNNFSSLTRFLRDKGIDASLLLMENELEHFLPASDHFDQAYKDYTYQWKWGRPGAFFNTPRTEILESVKEYDIIIGCGASPAFLMKAGRVLDIFSPYGGDVHHYPFYSPRRPKLISFNEFQRIGIQNARNINWSLNPARKKILDRIKPVGQQHSFSIPMIYTPLYNPENIKDYYGSSRWVGEFQKIRKEFDLVVFHHSRHFWKDDGDPFAFKGNDKLVVGFERFIRKRKDINSCLVMFEYGFDVQETKRLVMELGIEDNVRWFPVLPRKELMVGLSLCDIGAAEFSLSWVGGGTIFETLAMGKPLMSYRVDNLYYDQYPELYPLMNVKDSLSITRALQDYPERPDYYKKMGERSRKWLQKYVIDIPVREYIKLIERT